MMPLCAAHNYVLKMHKLLNSISLSLMHKKIMNHNETAFIAWLMMKRWALAGVKERLIKVQKMKERWVRQIVLERESNLSLYIFLSCWKNCNRYNQKLFCWIISSWALHDGSCKWKKIIWVGGNRKVSDLYLHKTKRLRFYVETHYPFCLWLFHSTEAFLCLIARLNDRENLTWFIKSCETNQKLESQRPGQNLKLPEKFNNWPNLLTKLS